MPEKYAYNNQQTRHSDDIQDIITSVPSWLLRWGISIFFGILVLIIGIAALIRYPDVVKTQLKIDSSNLPIPVTANTPGRLVKLVVTQNENVKAGQPLAYVENSANHSEVLGVLTNLQYLQQSVSQNKPPGTVFTNYNGELGELQTAYQSFLVDFQLYRSLTQGKNSTIQPAQNTKFREALGRCITVFENWERKYVLVAPRQGSVSFAGIVQENQVIDINHPVFYIVPENRQFFGEMILPQDNMGKIRAGQQVLIKLKAYPYEEYGIMKGKIAYIAYVPFKNMFIARVDFQTNKLSGFNQSVRIEPGMIADAEIITQDATILKRITKSFKIFGSE
jgi:multidrug efflux pump subunit AcrA (membrane-fusion protein)